MVPMHLFQQYIDCKVQFQRFHVLRAKAQVFPGYYLNKNVIAWRHFAIWGALVSLPMFVASTGLRNPTDQICRDCFYFVVLGGLARRRRRDAAFFVFFLMLKSCHRRRHGGQVRQGAWVSNSFVWRRVTDASQQKFGSRRHTPLRRIWQSRMRLRICRTCVECLASVRGLADVVLNLAEPL